jgi:4-amino-4-deoxy-L-arabinose transferase-like glycosyltransferase
MATQWRDARTSLRAAVVLATTPLFFVSAGAVMTDPALVLGTTLSMAGFWHAMTVEGRAARAWGYAFFAGLAVGLLAKGPVGVVLTLAPIGAWIVWKRRVADAWRRLPWITGLALTIAIALPWYVIAERRTPGFLEYFIVGEHWKRFTESGWKGDMFGTAHSRPRGTIWLFAIAFTLPWCGTWLALRRRARGAAAARHGDDFRAYLWLWMLWPAVFFTAAGNILFTYVLPGMPAFALLVADAWRRCEGDAWTRRLTTSAALAMPIVMLVAVALVLPRVGVERSNKALVTQYLAKRASDAERLVYVNEAPQSAEFYARGKVVTVPGTADVARLVADAPRDFFALTDEQAQELGAAVESRLAALARFGRYTLFVERPG